MTLEQFNRLTEEFSPALIEVSKKCEVEHPTVHSVSKIIRSFGLESKIVEKTRVVAELPIQSSASKNIALRIVMSDPVQAIIGLGALSFLTSCKEQMMGQLRVIFHTSKTGSNFSQKSIQEGELKNICGLWNLRTNSNISSGCVGIKLGSVFSTVEDFALTIFSRSNSSNVITATANIITTLNQLTSRKTDPLKPANITISSIHSSSAGTSIPNSVEVKGSYSSSDEAVAHQIPSLIKESVQGLTKAYGLEFEIQTAKHSAVTFDESLSCHLSNAAKEVLGSVKVVDLEYSRYPSPDLTHYLKAVPGTILEIGTGDSKSAVPLEESIRSGFKTVSWAFLKYLQ